MSTDSRRGVGSVAEWLSRRPNADPVSTYEAWINALERKAHRAVPRRAPMVFAHLGAGTLGVVLLQLGGPESLDGIQPFLERMFRDRDLFRLPVSERIQDRLASWVSRWRAKTVRPLYAAIGGKSPIGDITRRQADRVERELQRELKCKVVVAMRYSRPGADDAIQAVREAGCERVLLVPLFPQYSFATTRSSFLDWDRRCRANGFRVQTDRIEHYYHWIHYLRAWAQRIDEGLDRFPVGAMVHLVYSAHGVPKSFIERGDPYERQIRYTAECVSELVGDASRIASVAVCFQSRIGPQHWLGPSLTATLQRLARKRAKAVLVVPISFVSDHLETLSEIDVEAREFATRNGIQHFETTEGLNDSPLFIRALSELILERACFPQIR